MARPAGLEPATLGFVPLQFSLPVPPSGLFCGLDHIFAIAGMVRMASTEP